MKNILNKIKRKFHSRSGETLTETLVSVLIISVVSVGLAAMISTSANINAKAKEYDEALDEAVQYMERTRTDTLTVTVKVDGGSKGQVIFGDTNDSNKPKLRLGAETEENNQMKLYGYTYTVPVN